MARYSRATRDAIAYGLARYARRDSSSARNAVGEARLDIFKWDDAQKNRVLNALAVYRSTSYSPDALARLKALPTDAEDDTSREWHVRTALAIGDFKETLAALDDLSPPQQADSRWRYLRARVLTKLDRKSDAAPIFADVAREASFHGFLAADWIDEPYAICPRTLATDPAVEKSRREPDRPGARVRVPGDRHAARSATRMGFRACAKLDDARAPPRCRSRLSARLVRPRRVLLLGRCRTRSVSTSSAFRSRSRRASNAKRAAPASIRPGPTRSSAPKARG